MRSGSIVKADLRRLVEAVTATGRFLGPVADGDDMIKDGVFELSDVFGTYPGDVDTDLCHHPNGPKIDGRRRNTGGERFDLVAYELSGPCFGHLASAGIGGADKQDLLWEVF